MQTKTELRYYKNTNIFLQYSLLGHQKQGCHGNLIPNYFALTGPIY